jgi:hypothetical protein
MDDDNVEVVQKLNLVKLLQTSLERIHASRTKDVLAVELVRLYTLLSPLRKADATFESDWSTLLDGQFVQLVSTTTNPHAHRWEHLLRAEEMLMDLMERHGMGFQASLPDPVLKELADVEAQLDQLVAHSRDEPVPTAADLDDEEDDDDE